MPKNNSCGSDPMDATTWENCSMYRGHLRLALLRCLKEGEMHGLDMIHRIQNITSGAWEPSPGSVYPVLQEFEKLGLIKKREMGRAIVYSLTNKGEEAFTHLHSEVINHMTFLDWILKTEK
jgi:DNA-binding PadR family transcriptional regulator